MKKKITWVASLFIIFSSHITSAAIFDFNASNLGVAAGTANNSVNMISGGIGLTIQAYTIVNDGNGNITSQSLITGAGKGVYLSSNTSNPNLGVVSSLSGDGHSLDGGDSGTSEPDEGLLFTFNQVVSLDFINFDSFNSTSDDFNLTIDGVSTLVDFGSSDTSPFVSHDDGQNDHFFFNSFIGTEFLIWADSDSDRFRIDDLRVSSVNAVPLPATAFLFAPALLGFLGFRRHSKIL